MSKASCATLHLEKLLKIGIKMLRICRRIKLGGNGTEENLQQRQIRIKTSLKRVVEEGPKLYAVLAFCSESERSVRGETNRFLCVICGKPAFWWRGQGARSIDMAQIQFRFGLGELKIQKKM